MGKSTILIIIPSLVGGGAERALVNLLNRFDYDRYDLDLCVVVKRGIYFKDIPKQVNIISLFGTELFAKIFVKLHVMFNINWLYRLIARKKITGSYDAGISFLDSSFTDILFFLNTNQIRKKISWVHSSYLTYENFNKFYIGSYKNRIINNRYKKLDHIVFVSHDAQFEFQQIFGFPTKMSVIYNLIDTKGVILKSEELLVAPFANNVINIVAMGSLYPVKGYDKLIHAAKKLKNDGLNFKLRILGEGVLEKDLLCLIKQIDAVDVVEMLGFQSNPYPYLKASDIFVMTSISEALPTALCEAMVLGLPTLVTNCSGCREIVDNGQYGIMVAQTVDDIYDGLKKMIINEVIRTHYQRKSIERAAIFDDDAVLKNVYYLVDKSDNINQQKNLLK